MADENARKQFPDPASEAMQQALQAEERAREAIEGCQTQAEKLRERARADAEDIEDRADRRIEWIQSHCAKVLEGRLAEERAQEAQAPGEKEPWTDAAILAQAARDVAVQLTRPEAESHAREGDSS